MNRANEAFAELGVPMDPNKQEGPSTSLVYIGYTLNTVNMTIGTSGKQREKLLPLLDTALGQSITIDDLEKLIGKLGFISLPVRLGQSYLFYTRRELYAALEKKPSSTPTHRWHVHLRANSKNELRWWKAAVAADVTTPISLHIDWPSSAPIIEVWTDACEWGCGAIWGSSHLSLEWSQTIREITGIRTQTHRNMPLCEAIAVAVAVSTGRNQFAGKRVRLHTDCTAVVAGVNKGRASVQASEWLHATYRFINQICCESGIDLRAVHIKGTNNVYADLLSRNQMEQFQTLAEQHSLRVSPAQVLPIVIQPTLQEPSITFPTA